MLSTIFIIDVIDVIDVIDTGTGTGTGTGLCLVEEVKELGYEILIYFSLLL